MFNECIYKTISLEVLDNNPNISVNGKYHCSVREVEKWPQLSKSVVFFSNSQITFKSVPQMLTGCWFEFVYAS